MPTASAIEVWRARDAGEVEAAMALRHRVFCGEQGVSREEEVDGRDLEALHLVAVAGGRVIGTCRLLFEGETAKLGRMAVEREARGRGAGAAILEAAEREARARGARRIALHAQAAAASLYARGGFEARGEPFQEAGIEHVTMDKRLA